MIGQLKTQNKWYEDNKKGVPKNRNPYQYTSNVFKQGAWLTGWNRAESEKNNNPMVEEDG